MHYSSSLLAAGVVCAVITIHVIIQVKEVSKNLFMIMRDTVRMNEVKQDKDSAMRIDLMYRIAKGYQNSPALRITWLKSMAKEHGEVSLVL